MLQDLNCHLEKAAVDAVDLLPVVPSHIHKVVAHKNCRATQKKKRKRKKLGQIS